MLKFENKSNSNLKLVFLLMFFGLLLSSFKPNQNEFNLKVGEKAPEFEGKDQFGNVIKLSDLLKKGKVVLVFYRGQWCPYCNRHLGNLKESMNEITEKGGIIVAVSPEHLKIPSKLKRKPKPIIQLFQMKN